MENIFFYLFYIWVLGSVLMQIIFLFVFFWTIGKIPCTLPLILGIPTPKCRGTYPGGGLPWCEFFFLHFRMIQTMFKNKFKKKKVMETEPKLVA